jgi:mannose-6-phosphate isomerase class I
MVLFLQRKGVKAMFNKRPLNPVRNKKINIHEGLGQITKDIFEKMNNLYVVTVDGTHGVNFKHVISVLKHAFEKRSITVTSISTNDFLKTGEEIRELFKENISDNRVFGYVSEHTIKEYFKDEAKNEWQRIIAEKMKRKYPDEKHVMIIWGTGAHYLGGEYSDVSIFLDVSREYQQHKHKQGMLNFAFNWNKDTVEKYKIAYFIEWPILETYRKETLSSFNYYVDVNDEKHPKVVSVNDLFKMIDNISQYPMRVKPVFMPGVWGGQLLKKVADLPNDMVNCAWNFEPIAPENSILIESGEQVIEVPFLLVMAHSYKDIVGERIRGLFGDYFPVRFDYLDTMDGEHLSCQVHPKQSYSREKFNEFMEQQESYYIMEKKGDSKVYLGLTEQCEKEDFFQEVQKSQETGEPIQFTDYVQEWDSKKGDLFLIPTGTVHCSGKDNLVLEISATTWWFTFKIYDYVRKDLDGKPRPINIDYAFENIDFERRTNWVKGHLIKEPILLKRQGENEEYQLGKRDDLLFFVNRLHLLDSWVDDTNDELIMFNLVEGEKVRLESVEDPSLFVEFSYAESYILPAVFGKFRIFNIGSSPCKLIKAGVSPDWRIPLI